MYVLGSLNETNLLESTVLSVVKVFSQLFFFFQFGRRQKGI